MSASAAAPTILTAETAQTMGIPVVDLREYRSADAEESVGFIERVGRGLEDCGFVVVTGHGIDEALLREAYRQSERLFALPEAVKRRYETPADGRQRGYTSFGVEHARDTAVPDLKEFWHVGPELPLDHPAMLPPNQFPAELPEFRDVALRLFGEMQGFALTLLDAVAEYLGVRDGYFRELTRDGNHVLRFIHYPDPGEGAQPGAVRAAAHEDINLLTVLPASTRPGLEIRTRDGGWMPVVTPPNVMICDTGDMMQLITAGQLKSTTHRVVNPEGADGGRLSMPFFLHPNPRRTLKPLRGGDFEPVLADEFFRRRLREIGVE